VFRPDSAPRATPATPVFHIRRPDQQLLVQGKKPARVRSGHDDIYTIRQEVKHVGTTETNDFAHFENPSDDPPPFWRLDKKTAARKTAVAGSLLGMILLLR
jgi:hypothetical protein